jgi:hypothetical protein
MPKKRFVIVKSMAQRMPLHASDPDDTWMRLDEADEEYNSIPRARPYG